MNTRLGQIKINPEQQGLTSDSFSVDKAETPWAKVSAAEKAMALKSYFFFPVFGASFALLLLENISVSFAFTKYNVSLQLYVLGLSSISFVCGLVLTGSYLPENDETDKTNKGKNVWYNFRILMSGGGGMIELLCLVFGWATILSNNGKLCFQSAIFQMHSLCFKL